MRFAETVAENLTGNVTGALRYVLYILFCSKSMLIPQKNIKRPHTHIQKIMKVYGKNTIILIKPKQLRYWLPSIALRDADEVFADYIKARY